MNSGPFKEDQTIGVKAPYEFMMMTFYNLCLEI